MVRQVGARYPLGESKGMNLRVDEPSELRDECMISHPTRQDFDAKRRVRRPRRSWRGGVSLVEIIVATLILGFVAIGLVEFFAKGRVLFDQEERKRVATLLAQDALERTIARDYDQIVAWNTTRNVSSTSYAIAVTVEADSPQPNLKTIYSTVTWSYRPSVQRAVSLATMVFRQ